MADISLSLSRLPNVPILSRRSRHLAIYANQSLAQEYFTHQMSFILKPGFRCRTAIIMKAIRNLKTASE